MKRRTKVAALVAVGALVAVAVTGYLLLKPSSPINPRAYARIKQGMTQEEVEAVFGIAAGDYRDAEYVAAGKFPSEVLKCWGDFGQYCYPDGALPDGPVSVPVAWHCNDYSIQVGFGEGGVTGCLLQGRPARWSVLDRARAYLGW